EDAFVEGLGAVEVGHGDLEPGGDVGVEHRGLPSSCGIAPAQAAPGLLPAWRQHGACDNHGPDFRGLHAVSQDALPALSSQQRSLTRFLIEAQREGQVNAELRLLIEVVARACKRISVAVGKGALGGVLGDAEGSGGGSSINVQGEAQKKLDVLSNDILLEANAWGGHLAGLASEEMDHSQPIPDAYPRGNYLLLFDPLDGSSNIDVNVSVGTIFSV